MSPDILHRIQFRRVSWQPFQVDAPFEAGSVLLDQLGAVGGQPIPHNEQASGDPLQQMPPLEQQQKQPLGIP